VGAAAPTRRRFKGGGTTKKKVDLGLIKAKSEGLMKERPGGVAVPEGLIQCGTVWRVGRHFDGSALDKNPVWRAVTNSLGLGLS